jgi:hypothetical protein
VPNSVAIYCWQQTAPPGRTGASGRCASRQSPSESTRAAPRRRAAAGVTSSLQVHDAEPRLQETPASMLSAGAVAGGGGDGVSVVVSGTAPPFRLLAAGSRADGAAVCDERLVLPRAWVLW